MAAHRASGLQTAELSYEPPSLGGQVGVSLFNELSDDGVSLPCRRTGTLPHDKLKSPPGSETLMS